MKNKIIAAAVIMAMAFGLCSCKEYHPDTSDDSSGAIWTGGDFDGSGFRPTKPISTEPNPASANGSTNSENSEPIDEPYVDPFEEPDTSSDIPIGETIRIKNGEEYVAKSGETMVLSGTSEIEEGGSLTIGSGAELLVYGDLNLNGTLEIGGEMSIAKNASISGSGRIIVEDSFDQINCDGYVTAEIVPPNPIEVDGVTYVGGVLVANKMYSLPEDYGSGLSGELCAALDEMHNGTGYSFLIMSGFRSYEVQKNLFWSYVEYDGYDNAITYSAYPGTSEHQTGLAVDLGWVDEQYAYTEEGMWLAKNCQDYGFIIRYPQGKQHITGYIYEPWHVRYLGKSTAKLVHDSGLTLEEFLRVEG
ncbi:MAG: M15 family metallopeptidase [Ruminococcaceae bacterium]|nr:M15 family metallopeptidase [Oscillospiraceae bacterium]